jgi:hypothetical protein
MAPPFISTMPLTQTHGQKRNREEIADSQSDEDSGLDEPGSDENYGWTNEDDIGIPEDEISTPNQVGFKPLVNGDGVAVQP